jgi:hypothetical protein
MAATLLELSAVVWAVQKLHVYLHGSKFNIVTDHKTLEWLGRQKRPPGKLALWSLALTPYSLSIKYRPGTRAAGVGGWE